MKISESKKECRSIVETCKVQGKLVGFVPTMGALHRGHISLVERSKQENDFTVVSIFVNPTQFNDKNDLKNYPRTFDADRAMLDDAGVDLIFYPTVDEMYPEEDHRVFDFGDLDKVMEGAHRPGHFNGVAQVVSKLFDIVPASNAYFGQKDFQQLAIIKQLVLQLKLPINIVPCNIVREPDGLAMSSRNMLLSPEHRKNAVLISRTLFEACSQKGLLPVSQLKEWVVQTINKNDCLDVEYFDMVDDTYLKSIDNWEQTINIVGCIAVKAGNVRLIDNVLF